MKTTIQEHDFIHCEVLKNNFSYHGRIALFDYLEQLEEELSMDFEFDPICIRCQYSEYKNIQEFWADYDRYEYQCLEDIEENTTVIYIQNSESFIIEQF